MIKNQDPTVKLCYNKIVDVAREFGSMADARILGPFYHLYPHVSFSPHFSL